MRVLSIDPSYSSGVVVAEIKWNTIYLLWGLNLTVKHMKSSKPYHLHNEYQKIITSFDFDAILYEKQYRHNMFIITGVLLSAIPPGVSVYDCRPQSIRKTLFNAPNLSKEESHRRFKQMYPRYKDIEQEDILDALIQLYGWAKEMQYIR